MSTCACLFWGRHLCHCLPGQPSAKPPEIIVAGQEMRCILCSIDIAFQKRHYLIADLDLSNTYQSWGLYCVFTKLSMLNRPDDVCRAMDATKVRGSQLVQCRRDSSDVRMH